MQLELKNAINVSDTVTQHGYSDDGLIVSWNYGDVECLEIGLRD